MIALLAPGQGAQKSGMLAAWLELPGIHDRVAQWSKAAGLDLVRLGTTADDAEITDTAVTQPLVVATALLVFEEIAHRGLFDAHPELGSITAGHSVGELAAAAFAGVISCDDAVALAATRGRAMAEACALEETGMTAILGGVEADVLARLDELNLVPANRNAPGQIVAAGSLPALAALAENPPERAKLRPLAVAGAFHSKYMAPAQDAVAEAASSVDTANPERTLLSNSDGKPVTTGSEALNKIVAQVTNPVRWDLCNETLQNITLGGIVELTPAGTLTGIAKRSLRGVPQVAVNTPEDLDKLVELLNSDN
ncbi:ACP S-malonyltransferase [Hoyosella rhizosphaerae]|uniref:[acyl-carrier-protein] S-malonyltransferase n=1 Tax=Hoyosella rhizosphaerae TaxID=1755582 RepID=A0A916UFI6_9ACTN|nr:ACP S-malonyltransferase [Hoyosella rhizosphaerae]MBN4928011.1 ACP S-malonyltransferase [Hoyosella rhizosphaerae]GGC71698.1 malonyl CoA-acyl carrier protein transacylase [Hoyosella rhizosphaerae]